MITREFVQKYLNIKELLERKEIDDVKYRAMIIKLCCEYQIDPVILTEYNVNLEPKKFDTLKD